MLQWNDLSLIPSSNGSLLSAIRVKATETSALLPCCYCTVYKQILENIVACCVCHATNKFMPLFHIANLFRSLTLMASCHSRVSLM